MKWAHLPLEGGIYNQSPQLLDEWSVIFSAITERNETDRREMERKNAAAKSKKR